MKNFKDMTYEEYKEEIKNSKKHLNWAIENKDLMCITLALMALDILEEARPDYDKKMKDEKKAD